MIELRNVCKTYETRGLKRRVFHDLNLRIDRGDSLAICGANGAGKSTLMRLIAGVEHPTSGHVVREMSTSWPMGIGSCFQQSMTGADNARFIARVYRQDEARILSYVEDFAQLGVYMNQTLDTYSSGMRSRLAFGISLAIDFDCYLVDEVTAVGDIRFQRRCTEELKSRRDNGTLIMISHDSYTLQEYCTRGAVLYGGALIFFDSVTEACEVHHALQMRGY